MTDLTTPRSIICFMKFMITTPEGQVVASGSRSKHIVTFSHSSASHYSTSNSEWFQKLPCRKSIDYNEIVALNLFQVQLACCCSWAHSPSIYKSWGCLCSKSALTTHFVLKMRSIVCFLSSAKWKKTLRPQSTGRSTQLINSFCSKLITSLKTCLC